MNALDVIRVKRDGGELSPEQIRWFIDAYTEGVVADEQASALLMAIVWRGLTPAELSVWTATMLESGDRLDLSEVGRPTVDKHSTGGVGDKVSLILCPLVAACGAAVPQLSGRGLGHTGGTLDKMESIPGWRADLSPDEMIDALRTCGAAITAAGPGLAPADAKLYALRDTTGTVEAIPLIASSIMSKKIAEGTDALVLDVKYGSGAFLPDPDDGRELARTMVGLGAEHGVRTAALLTDMDQPLGRTAGNAVEVAESVEVLAGGGPADLVEVTLALADQMVDLAGLDADPAAVLASGQAMDAWREMVAVQGGDPDAELPTARHTETVKAVEDGIVQRIDARSVGDAAWRLGAGRARKGDPVSAGAGVTLRAVAGDRVRTGDPLFDLHTDEENRVSDALDALEGAVTYGPDAPADRTPRSRHDRTRLMLTGAEREAFDRDGYLVLERFASEQACARIRQRSRETVDEFDPEAEGGASIFTTDEQTRHSDAYFLGSGDKVRCFFEEDAFDDSGQRRRPVEESINKIGHAMHDLDPVFEEFSRTPELASLCSDVGLADPKLLQSMVIFKQPRIGGAVNEHTDHTFLWTDPPSVIGFWFALEPATVDNACLWVLPGAHRIPGQAAVPARRSRCHHRGRPRRHPIPR